MTSGKKGFGFVLPHLGRLGADGVRGEGGGGP
jgi:hypothetical protein